MEDLVFTMYFMGAAALALGVLEGLRRAWYKLRRALTRAHGSRGSSWF